MEPETRLTDIAGSDEMNEDSQDRDAEQCEAERLLQAKRTIPAVTIVMVKAEITSRNSKGCCQGSNNKIGEASRNKKR